jgi:hypothetical protein
MMVYATNDVAAIVSVDRVVCRHNAPLDFNRPVYAVNSVHIPINCASMVYAVRDYVPTDR